jgi:flagellar hook assembly protein FlgD
LPELDTHWESTQLVEFTLSQNYPNPFNPTTTLKYDLPEDAMVNITIYDMMGRVVKTMVNTQQNAGYKSIQWNATNNAGQPVSAGLYLYTIEAGAFRQTKKMVLLK